jgi:hypothetical protein
MAEKPQQYWEMGDEYACYRPAGKVSFMQMIALCAEAIAFAGSHEARRLLIDTRALIGFGVPNTVQRYEFADRLSQAKQKAGRVKIVFLARPKMIDPDHFGLDVARNRGFYTAIFPSEEEALEWLMHEST